MFSPFQILDKLFLSIGFTFLFTSPVLAQLSLAEINSIARQTTVLIAPGLTDEFVAELEGNRNNPLASKHNRDGIWNPGSGVIIAREENTYYVLTVSHNFKQRYLEQNIPHGIRTSDGKVHLVMEVNDGRNCPLQANLTIKQLIRLGCYSVTLPGRIAGTDLAIVSFASSQEYAIASLGDAQKTSIGDRIYISGWPDPEKEKDPLTGRCRGKVTQRQRRLAWTTVTRTIAIDNSENGYSLFYLDVTSPGMSGGPVFDSEGFVVGVHGRGSADKGNIVRKNCSYDPSNNLLLASNNLESNDFDKITAAAVTYTTPKLHNQFSSGQNASNILDTWSQLGLKLLFNFEPPSRDLIKSAFTDIVFTPGTSSRNGQQGAFEFSFSPKDAIVGQVNLDSPQDVIDDIYNSYIELVEKLAEIKDKTQTLEDYNQNRLEGLRELIEQMRPEMPPAEN